MTRINSNIYIVSLEVEGYYTIIENLKFVEKLRQNRQKLHFSWEVGISKQGCAK
jgi:hypothetical protein